MGGHQVRKKTLVSREGERVRQSKTLPREALVRDCCSFPERKKGGIIWKESSLESNHSSNKDKLLQFNSDGNPCASHFIHSKLQRRNLVLSDLTTHPPLPTPTAPDAK